MFLKITKLYSRFTSICLVNLSIFLGIINYSHAQGPDLPNPPSNLELIKISSYVIAIDNTNQSLIGMGITA